MLGSVLAMVILIVASVTLRILNACGFEPPYVRSKFVERLDNRGNAEDVEDALTTCANYGNSIDLLLTDVVMPKMSGPLVAEK